jgi:hypothetical protein
MINELLLAVAPFLNSGATPAQGALSAAQEAQPLAPNPLPSQEAPPRVPLEIQVSSDNQFHFEMGNRVVVPGQTNLRDVITSATTVYFPIVPADAGPVPHGNTISNSTEGPASPGRFPYEPDERIGGDSVLSIHRRLLSSKRFPSAEDIDFARMQAEDLFEVKVKIIDRMKVLDPTGDWQGRGARALDSPNSATGESSLKRLYSLLEDIDRKGRISDAFFSLSEKVALRKDNLDAESSA